MAELTHKTCSKCKREQTIDQFWADIRYKDGYMGVCKSCRRENTKRYMEKHPEHRLKRLNASKNWHKEQKVIKNADNILGGWTIYIPNYVKNREFKFNAISTNGESFKTNTYTDFVDWIHKIFATKA